MIVGREAETVALQDFFAADGAERALVLSGPAGIGKTTLWDAGIAMARERGLRVLVARPSDAEMDLAYAALADLLDEVTSGELAPLPAPQREALEVALLRAEPAAAAPAARAIAAGLLATLRVLAAQQPLLVAIDDVQWLDASSAQALAFAARRLTDQPVGFLLAQRTGSAPALVRALGVQEPLEVGPLSYGAIRALLAEGLGLTLTRRVLRTLAYEAGGNPLFALELGRTLHDRGPLAIGEELRLPAAVEDLFVPRVACLDAGPRMVLLAAALDPDVRAPQLAALASPEAVEEAIELGLLVAARDRVRPAHPLLAVAARRHAGADERREVLLELVRVASGAERRAHHLALATELPDEAVAARVAAAAAAAAARGAVVDSAALAEHALRLTPPAGAKRVERLLALADYLVIAGEPRRVTDLLAPEVDVLPPGQARVRAQLLLADGGAVKNADDLERHLDLAVAAAGGDAGLLAQPLAWRAEVHAVARVQRIADAEASAVKALTAARHAGPETQRHARTALAWTRALGGRSLADLVDRDRDADDPAVDLYRTADRVAAMQLLWRGDVAAARARISELLAAADERGQAFAYVVLRLNLCEAELRAGDCGRAEQLLEAWDATADGELLIQPGNERCRALLAAVRGDPEAAQRWAAEAIVGWEETQVAWDLLEAQRAQGLAALAAGAPERAIEPLQAAWEHMLREGVRDPGAFPVAPDLAEALIEVGSLDGAREVADRLEATAVELDHPWAQIGARRCRALIEFAAGGGADAPTQALLDAAAAYEQRGLQFDQARTLLGLGRAVRRLRRWGAARAALERAAAVFERNGSIGWAEQARTEAGRLGARPPRPAGELTLTEQRVAELAAGGLANKEIAAMLFVTVSTIEAHLSHVYAKLGVRSRAQLAGRLTKD